MLSIILIGHEPKLLEISIFSIRNFIKDIKYEIFMIAKDIQSLEHSVIYAQKGEIKFINTKSNNLSQIFIEFMENAKGDLLLIMYAGTILSFNAVKNMEQILFSNDKFAAVEPMMNFSLYDNGQNINTPYKTILEFEEFARQISEKQSESMKVLVLNGTCLLMRYKTMLEIGVPDGKLESFWAPDYSLRLLRSGYNLMMCKNAFVHCSFVNNFSQIQINNFLTKWGFNLSNQNFTINSFSFIDLQREKISLLNINSDVAVMVRSLKSSAYPPLCSRLLPYHLKIQPLYLSFLILNWLFGILTNVFGMEHSVLKLQFNLSKKI